MGSTIVSGCTYRTVVNVVDQSKQESARLIYFGTVGFCDSFDRWSISFPSVVHVVIVDGMVKEIVLILPNVVDNSDFVRFMFV